MLFVAPWSVEDGFEQATNPLLNIMIVSDVVKECIADQPPNGSLVCDYQLSVMKPDRCSGKIKLTKDGVFGSKTPHPVHTERLGNG